VKPDDATGQSATVTSVVPDLSPYPLPPQVFEGLQALAAESDVLIVGEMHGTSEVPRVIAELLPALEPLGYRGLALKIPADVRDDLAGWAMNEERPVPGFFAAPNFDGRGNAEALALVRAALRPPNAAHPWQLLCFDATDDQPFAQWAERDARMARNLAAHSGPGFVRTAR